jgi:hypothetical protein
MIEIISDLLICPFIVFVNICDKKRFNGRQLPSLRGGFTRRSNLVVGLLLQSPVACNDALIAKP